MNANVIEKDGKTYIEGMAGKTLIENEQDVLDVLVLCGEHHTNQVMLYAENLPETFFDLKTRVAGNILQKFVTYSVKVAAVLSSDSIKQGKFREMVVEANRGRHFRVFHNRKEAEEWLIAM